MQHQMSLLSAAREQAIAAGNDSCGCVMGAKFLGVGMAGSVGWFVWHWRSNSLSVWSVGWRVLAISFSAAIVGKLIGLLLFRMRAARNTGHGL